MDIRVVLLLPFILKLPNISDITYHNTVISVAWIFDTPVGKFAVGISKPENQFFSNLMLKENLYWNSPIYYNNFSDLIEYIIPIKKGGAIWKILKSL